MATGKICFRQLIQTKDDAQNQDPTNQFTCEMCGRQFSSNTTLGPHRKWCAAKKGIPWISLHDLKELKAQQNKSSDDQYIDDWADGSDDKNEYPRTSTS